MVLVFWSYCYQYQYFRLTHVLACDSQKGMLKIYGACFYRPDALIIAQPTTTKHDYHVLTGSQHFCVNWRIL